MSRCHSRLVPKRAAVHVYLRAEESHNRVYGPVSGYSPYSYGGRKHGQVELLFSGHCLVVANAYIGIVKFDAGKQRSPYGVQ